jgi:hypothetical protein
MKGVVYKITGGDEVYVGSTIQPLSVRWSEHLCYYEKYKEGKRGKCMSYELFDRYEIDNCKMEVLEEWEGEDRTELLFLEKKWINELDCINKKCPIWTLEEKKEYQALWRRCNPDKVKKQKEKYIATHEQQVKETSRRYEKEKRKRSEEHKQRMKEKYKCACGGQFTHQNKAVHSKTIIHQKWLQSQQQ